MNFAAEHLLLLTLALFCRVKRSLAIETDLTVDIEAGRRECFHQFVGADSSFEVEYQVGPKFSLREKLFPRPKSFPVCCFHQTFPL